MVLGLVCIDTSVAPPQLCQTPFYPMSAQPTIFNVWDAGRAPIRIGNRFFAVDGANHLLLCWDITAMAPCPGNDYPMDHGIVISWDSIANLGERILAWTDTSVYCFFTFSSPLTVCPGFPLTWGVGIMNGTSIGETMLPPIPHVDASSGLIDGACFSTGNKCIDFVPSARTDWINPWNDPALISLQNVSFLQGYRAAFVTLNTRVFIYA